MLALIVVAMSAACVNMYMFAHGNIRRDQIQREYLERGEIHPHNGKTLEEVQDDHISFRYIV